MWISFVIVILPLSVLCCLMLREPFNWSLDNGRNEILSWAIVSFSSFEYVDAGRSNDISLSWDIKDLYCDRKSIWKCYWIFHAHSSRRTTLKIVHLGKQNMNPTYKVFQRHIKNAMSVWLWFDIFRSAEKWQFH